MLHRGLWCLVGALFVTGCTTIGAHIISNPDTYLASHFQDIDLQRFDTEKRTYCLNLEPPCIKYLYAKAYQPAKFTDNTNVYYTVDASGNGVTNRFTYTATPEMFNRKQGTAILFHGFGGKKEAMLVTSIYFRALGMDVIAVELFGHGESDRDFVFGAKEHGIISRLIEHIDSTASLTKPVIAIGHSMGALPTANTMLESGEVDGAILMAPMTRFDDAATFYLAYKSPLLNRLFSGHLDDIVSAAMKKKNISPTETDISEIISQTTEPTLIINSDVDTVSPPDRFAHLDNELIQVEVVKGRSHASLIAFDEYDATTVETWLANNFGSAP